MIYTGYNIKQSQSDLLIPIEDHQLVEMIKNQDAELKSKTERLRKVAAIDKKVYQEIKTGLPYFIGARFRDNLRNSENFIEIDKLVIDLDHCLKSPKQSQDLKDLIKEQPDVWMMFVSPSGDGIKIVFKLKSPMQDLVLYKAYYQWFASNFAEKIRLIGTLDTRTCDATRVCFMAHDANVYTFSDADTLDWEKWAMHRAIEVPENQLEIQPILKPLTPAIYDDLKKLVSPNVPIRPKVERFVPEIIAIIQERLTKAILEKNLEIDALVPIQYGLKFCVKRHIEKAEVTVFYGKRGFSVVETPKSTVSKALNREVYQIIFDTIFNFNQDGEI